MNRFLNQFFFLNIILSIHCFFPAAKGYPQQKNKLKKQKKSVDKQKKNRGKKIRKGQKESENSRKHPKKSEKKNKFNLNLS